ncbi:CcoQ/FixQ family Cbb3-type cytochrome c oxidase assembly chaperone [Afifella sp. IM 167]|nr:CcoQ/FixQ family Cbb3-type cytochrome c oxidase assembly chaperone [Afifella sp. IM 167]
MSTYDTLRHFADSWGLLFMLLIFLAVVVWVLRPGARTSYSEQADIPFKHEDRPAPTAKRADKTPVRGD